MASSRALSFVPVAFAALALSREARADCEPPQPASTEALPAPWRAAVDALVRSAAEPGHPWSCSGGRIELELEPNGALLHVARAGESAITRPVTDPDDVVPLGQALLAAPLDPPTPPPPVAPPPPVMMDTPARSPIMAAIAPRKEPRLLVGGGVDARGVGGTGVAWTGLAANAAVPMGRWLPSLSLRQQSALFSNGPSIDELSVAVALQYRVPIRKLELRAGMSFRGAAVIRDLPRPRGEQSQLQGRIGGVTSLVIPVVHAASFLFWLDGDVVALSRETTSPASTSNASAKPFPTFTLGGGMGVEIAL